MSADPPLEHVDQQGLVQREDVAAVIQVELVDVVLVFELLVKGDALLSVPMVRTMVEDEAHQAHGDVVVKAVTAMGMPTHDAHVVDGSVVSDALVAAHGDAAIGEPTERAVVGRHETIGRRIARAGLVVVHLVALGGHAARLAVQQGAHRRRVRRQPDGRGDDLGPDARTDG